MSNYYDNPFGNDDDDTCFATIELDDDDENSPSHTGPASRRYSVQGRSPQEAVSASSRKSSRGASLKQNSQNARGLQFVGEGVEENDRENSYSNPNTGGDYSHRYGNNNNNNSSAPDFKSTPNTSQRAQPYGSRKNVNRSESSNDHQKSIAKMRESEQRYSDLEEAMTETQDMYESLVASLRSELQDAQQQNSQLHSDKMKLEQQVRSLKLEKDSIEFELQQANNNNRMLQNQIAQLEEELETLGEQHSQQRSSERGKAFAQQQEIRQKPSARPPNRDLQSQLEDRQMAQRALEDEEEEQESRHYQSAPSQEMSYNEEPVNRRRPLNMGHSHNVNSTDRQMPAPAQSQREAPAAAPRVAPRVRGVRGNESNLNLFSTEPVVDPRDSSRNTTETHHRRDGRRSVEGMSASVNQLRSSVNLGQDGNEEDSYRDSHDASYRSFSGTGRQSNPTYNSNTNNNNVSSQNSKRGDVNVHQDPSALSRENRVQANLTEKEKEENYYRHAADVESLEADLLQHSIAKDELTALLQRLDSSRTRSVADRTKKAQAERELAEEERVIGHLRLQLRSLNRLQQR